MAIGLRFLLVCVMFAAAPAWGQSGLKLPERGELGIDPSFARGWFAPEYDQFGFAAPHWRDSPALAAATAPRMRLSYSFGQRASLGMSLSREREADLEQRPLSLFGRYWFAQDWALSAESLSRDPLGLLRLQDFRIGLQRRF